MQTLMKSNTLFRAVVVAGALSAGLTARPAQAAYDVLRNLSSADGYYPYATMVVQNNVVYGITWVGGSIGGGTIFKMNSDGSGYTVLRNLDGATEGFYAQGALMLSGQTLYGTCTNGGVNGQGTTFKINTDGSGWKVLHAFSGADGEFPNGKLAVKGNAVYGICSSDTNMFHGNVYKVNTDGTGFAILHTFTGSADGDYPYGGLVVKGKSLYGTTGSGGASSNGVVFKMNTSGSGFTVIHDFDGTQGGNPLGDLLLKGKTLYSTTNSGGAGGYGTIFKVNTNGAHFTVLHQFDLTQGGSPIAGVALVGSDLYGTTTYGGSAGQGVVYRITTKGMGYTVLYDFLGGSDGANPQAGVVFDGTSILGNTSQGGNNMLGTIFRLDP